MLEGRSDTRCMWLERSSFTLLVLCLTACNRDDRRVVVRETPAASTRLRFAAPADPSACSRALQEACGTAECATFEKARQFVLARREPGCISGGLGTCGSHRFLEKDSGFDKLLAYFDGSGALVALSVRNDSSGECVWGSDPTCNKVLTEKVCP